jgi:hypothetical protein
LAAFTELTVEQGATFIEKVNVLDVYNNPVNLTGYTAASMMRKSYYSSSYYVIEADVTGTSNGEITLAISSANTSSLTPGRYVYDLIIRDDANTVNRVVEGIVTVLPSVTR